jgi:hypothetical protein
LEENNNAFVPTVKTLSKDNVGQTFNNLSSQLNIDPYLQLEQKNIHGKTTKDTLGISVYTDVIKEVTLGNYKSYTMRISSENDQSSIFYNLTLEDKNGQPDMFVTQYIPTQNWLNDQNQVFEGNITTMSIDDITHAPPSGGGGSTEPGSGYPPDPQGSPYYPTNCDGVVIVTYESVAYSCGCGHMPGDDCQGCTSSSPMWSGYHEIPYYYCDATDYGSDPRDDTNNPNPGGGGGGSGNGDGTSPDDTPITVLIPPGEECENPPPGDLNGDCKLDAYEVCLLQGNSKEVCECVADRGTVEECLQDIKCERLNRLVQTDGLGSDILPVVNQLRTKLGAGNNEWSMSYKNVLSEEGRKNVTDDDGLQEGPSDERSPFNYTTTWIGQIHSHPEGKFAVPSWLDIRALKLLHTESYDVFNDEVFIMVVAPNNITYALRVDNIQTLIDKIDADMQNAKGNNDDEKRKYIKEEMREDYSNSSNLEKTFLELFGDYGISFYEATDATLSNWKQLELDENDNETVTETPCN